MDTQAIAELRPNELQKLLQSIGNTPLRPIYLEIQGVIRTVHLKLEGENPGGSVKDRTGYALIQALEHQRLLNKQSIVVESTSGNLGVALSMICKAKGYHFLAVVDPKATQENIEKMQMLGASIEVVHRPDAAGSYLSTRLARVQELCNLSSTYVWPNQYANPANPEVHFAHTGPEIYRQMHSKIDAIFIAVSTGGTLAGIGRYLRMVSPATCITGVDARGSVIFGTPAGPRKLTGIGSSRVSNFLTAELYDRYHLVRDEEAFGFCRAVFSAIGLKLGGSSGAALFACASYLATHPRVANIVCLCADTGENYTSSIFNDQWIQQQKLGLSREQPVQNILAAEPQLSSHYAL